MRNLCLVILLLALAVRPTRAEEPEADMLQVGDIHIPISFVTKVETAWLTEQKAADPNFEVSDLPAFRRDIALKQLEIILMARYVKDHNLTCEPAEAERRLNEFKESLTAQGIVYDRYLACMARSDEDFRKANVNLVAIETYFGKEVKEAEIDQVLKERARQIPYRRCSHILFMYKVDAESQATRTKEEAKKLAEEALEKIKGGADFEKLAKEVSECPSRVVGGDLEWNGQEGQLVKVFADALYKLEKIGDLSGVIETEYGYHIIKLTGLKTDADFRSTIKDKLTQEKVDAFLQQMREENVEKVKWNDKALNAPLDPKLKLITVKPPEESTPAPEPAVPPETKSVAPEKKSE